MKTALINAVAVGSGGFLGALARYGLSGLVHRHLPLTTFSTFGYETLAMIRDDEYLRAAGNAGMHVILGLALVWLGYALTTSR
jgi:fluoride ion exporter CrcB/FEX